MNSQPLLWISVCLFAGASSAAAQERLTLADATTRALAKNHAIRVEREATANADARMTGARGEYDPQLHFDLTARHHKDPITSLFSGAPVGDVAPSQNSVAGTFSVSQLFKSGATATVSASASREGSNSSFILFEPAFGSSLGVDVRQPLLRNRAIDSARAALRVTALDRDRSGAALATQVLQTVSQVETAYWQLVAARRDLEVRRANLTLAEQQRTDTQVRIQGGTVAPSEIAQPTAEVERRRGDTFAAQEAVARAERTLKQLILEDAADPMWTTDLTPADAPETAPTPVDVAVALADAAKNRPELTEISARISQQDVNVTLARDALKPRLDLVAGYTMRGLAGGNNDLAFPFGGIPAQIPDTLSGGFGTSWSTLGTQKFPDASVGVSFDLPIGHHAALGDLGAAEATRRQTATTLAQTQQQIAIEVRNAATAIETAVGRLQAARAGLEAAQTQLRAEQDRFGVGLSTNFFVLTRQNDLAQAQLAESAALTDYRKAITELARATGTLLRDRNITIENELAPTRERGAR